MSMHNNRRIGAALAALVVATAGIAPVAWSQTASETAATQSGSTALEEVVVSARKTVENIQDVPLAIRSFDVAELARSGQGGLLEISELTPGFVFQTYASTFDSSPTVRGLAQFDVTSPVANVSTEVNGVYIPRNYEVDVGLADISRVEIVKGPQSALYGSNAFAGVIGYTLAAPPTKPTADVVVTTGNAGRIDTKFDAGDSWFDNVVAVRANYASSKYDGTWANNYPTNEYGKNQSLGGHDNQEYGGSIRIEPLKTLEVDFDYFHLDRHEDLKPAYNVTNPGGDPQNKYNCAPYFICGTLSYDPGAYQSATSTRLPGIVQAIQPGFTSGTDFYTGRLRFDLTDELRLNYIYGWVGSYATEITSSSDNPVTPTIGPNYNVLAGCLANPAILLTPTCVFSGFDAGSWVSAQKEGSTNQLGSHEVRLEWNHGPIKALVGFYSSRNTDNYAFQLGSFAAGSPITGAATVPFNFTGFPFALLGQVRSFDDTAEFGRVSYDFFDSKANVSAEVRHSSDDLHSEASTTGTLAGATAADVKYRSVTYDETTPRFTASYKLTPNQLLYASAAEGVKEGGFNPIVDSGVTLTPAQQSFAPEKNWTYELGTKNTLFDGRAIINADVFYVNWSNLQIEEQPSNATVGGTVAVITVNQGGATSKGLESDGKFAVTRNLELTYSAAFIDSTFDSGDVSGELLGLCAPPICPTNAAIGGKDLPRYSKVQAAGGATWRQPLTTDINYSVHGEFTYQSQQQVDEMNLAQIPSRTLVNANATLSGEKWDLTLWGKNILNKKYVADSFFIPVASEGSVGYGVSLGELATYGVTFALHL